MKHMCGANASSDCWGHGDQSIHAPAVVEILPSHSGPRVSSVQYSRLPPAGNVQGGRAQGAIVLVERHGQRQCGLRATCPAMGKDAEFSDLVSWTSMFSARPRPKFGLRRGSRLARTCYLARIVSGGRLDVTYACTWPRKRPSRKDIPWHPLLSPHPTCLPRHPLLRLGIFQTPPVEIRKPQFLR